MMADLGGAFVVHVTEPDIVFQTRNPLLLTHRGRVRAKNIVLIVVGRVVAAWSSLTATPDPIAAIAGRRNSRLSRVERFRQAAPIRWPIPGTPIDLSGRVLWTGRADLGLRSGGARWAK